jgi:hypothetical protein
MPRIHRSLLIARVALATLCTAGGLPAAEPLPRQRYALTIETGMPHLEENLRYAIRRESRCLTEPGLATAFPVLKQSVLKGCRLASVESPDQRVRLYALQCTGGHGTTGSAHWQAEPGRVLGTLSVKLGGKNMTFFQRITAVPSGGCLQ